MRLTLFVTLISFIVLCSSTLAEAQSGSTIVNSTTFEMNNNSGEFLAVEVQVGDVTVDPFVIPPGGSVSAPMPPLPPGTWITVHYETLSGSFNNTLYYIIGYGWYFPSPAPDPEPPADEEPDLFDPLYMLEFLFTGGK